mmetsp:Transcript_4796/g.11795  ORF Transcript_4796/g.11795 Transcript_4796/m.11795 type:complete len:264 (+) Transcript_4796:177-968(+)|eukprot:CAMPEP_0179000088 /NCGR_PEP_ID=MMETSP0795-20121207/10462_1 /TAXON_ID=88552 /ORGANISM="Amoebophrya sp., Strain Ameob2" /LENGTH=263 /DNA_ID=CAMNT_0020693015 /DNA_START=118 /DNA_END=909 /DNA_ORIENTATION=-
MFSFSFALLCAAFAASPTFANLNLHAGTPVDAGGVGPSLDSAGKTGGMLGGRNPNLGDLPPGIGRFGFRKHGETVPLHSQPASSRGMDEVQLQGIRRPSKMIARAASAGNVAAEGATTSGGTGSKASVVAKSSPIAKKTASGDVDYEEEEDLYLGEEESSVDVDSEGRVSDEVGDFWLPSAVLGEKYLSLGTANIRWLDQREMEDETKLIEELTLQEARSGKTSILCAMISLGVMMSVVAAGLAMGGSDKKREAPQGSYSFDS